MDEHFNPVTFILSIIIHGIILGAILAVAWPVKCLLTGGATKLWNKSTDLLRKPEVVRVNAATK